MLTAHAHNRKERHCTLPSTGTAAVRSAYSHDIEPSLDILRPFNKSPPSSKELELTKPDQEFEFWLNDVFACHINYVKRN